MATKKTFAVKHNLDQLSKEELVQYLRDVSEFIGLDPDLNGLDTIWMNNETGPGRALVVYARRGTAEILRNIYGVEVESLTYAQVNGSMVFTAIGRSKARDNRQEIAIGSKFIGNLSGKDLDDAIMTASTRALRRLTMQFTTLGVLDESEIVAILGHIPNPAGSAQLAANPLPPMYAVPSVPANNAPGKLVLQTVVDHQEGTVAHTEPLGEPFVGQQDQIDAAMAQVTEKRAARQADKEVDTKTAPATTTPVESTTSTDTKPDIEAATEAPKRARRPRKSVSLEVEPEVVNSTTKVVKTETILATKVETIPAPPPQAAPAPEPPKATPPAPAAPVVGMPSAEQMAEYRKKVGVYTAELPSSEGMGSVQKMRAFITHMSGNPPQDMSVTQWEETIAWFDAFVAKNAVKGLIKYINDTLGVK